MFRRAKPHFISVLALVTLVIPASAEEPTEGRRLAELAFESLDHAERGYIDQGNFWNFGYDVFTSMDSDESASISLATSSSLA